MSSFSGLKCKISPFKHLLCYLCFIVNNILAHVIWKSFSFHFQKMSQHFWNSCCKLQFYNSAQQKSTVCAQLSERVYVCWSLTAMTLFPDVSVRVNMDLIQHKWIRISRERVRVRRLHLLPEVNVFGCISRIFCWSCFVVYTVWDDILVSIWFSFIHQYDVSQYDVLGSSRPKWCIWVQNFLICFSYS